MTDVVVAQRQFIDSASEEIARLLQLLNEHGAALDLRTIERDKALADALVLSSRIKVALVILSGGLEMAEKGHQVRPELLSAMSALKGMVTE